MTNDTRDLDVCPLMHSPARIPESRLNMLYFIRECIDCGACVPRAVRGDYDTPIRRPSQKT